MKRIPPAIVSLVVLLCGACMVAADPGLPDTLYVDSVVTEIPLVTALPIRYVTDEPLSGIEITLRHNSAFIVIDSVSLVGGCLEGVDFKGYSVSGDAVTVFGLPCETDLIPAGAGLLGTIHVSYLDSVQGQLITFDTATVYLQDSLIERRTVFTTLTEPQPFTPQFRPGYYELKDRCCAGATGNANCDPENKVNLADIYQLVDRVYLSRHRLCCETAGNINGDPAGVINLADISFLIDNVYLSKRPTAPCP